MCASYTQHALFDFTEVLFHTLFNRTVENFHTSFTFAGIFSLQLVWELHWRLKFFGCDDWQSQTLFGA